MLEGYFFKITTPPPPPPSLLVHLCEPIITVKNLIEIFTVVVFQFWRIHSRAFYRKGALRFKPEEASLVYLYICKCCCT